MLFSFYFFYFFVFFVVPVSAVSLPRSAVVEKVIDGDTVRLSTGQLVRYIGVDTPEVRHRVGDRWVYAPEPYAEKAMAFNKQLVEGKTVHLEWDETEQADRHGRLLAYLFVGNTFVNQTLLDKGLARLYCRQKKYCLLFASTEAAAKLAQRGIWSRAR